VTVFDVLDNYFGDSKYEVGELNSKQVEELLFQVNLFYNNYQEIPESNDTDFCAYFGWDFASNFLMRDNKDYLTTSLLYAHKVVLFDPLAIFASGESIRHLIGTVGKYNRKVLSVPMNSTERLYFMFSYDGIYKSANFDLAKKKLAECIDKLKAIKELVKKGFIVLICPIPIVLEKETEIIRLTQLDLRNEEYLANLKQLRDDVPIPIDGLRDDGNLQVLEYMGLNIFEEVSYYFNKDLLLAANSDSQYIAPHETDYKIAKLKASSLLVEDLNTLVIPILETSEFPLFQGISYRDIFHIRSNNEEFEQFRILLRDVVRKLKFSNRINSEQFQRETKQLVSDTLDPQITRINEESKKSSFFGRTLVRDNYLSLASGIVVSSVLINATGNEMAGIGPSLGAVLKILLTGLFGKNCQHVGANKVLFKLTKRK